MISVGNTTPACQGSKYTSISCSPRKYHGALDGFGVRVGFAGSSSGALVGGVYAAGKLTEFRERLVKLDRRGFLRCAFLVVGMNNRQPEIWRR